MDVHFVDAMLRSLGNEADEAKDRFSKLTRMPKCMPPISRALWHDAAFCFTFGRYYAALVVSTALIEGVLRQAIPFSRARQGLPVIDLPTGLHGVIQRAEEVGIVPPDEAALLQETRKRVRNVVAHGKADALADALFKIEKGSWYSVSDAGQLVRDNIDPDDLAQLAAASGGKRLEAAAKEFAYSVVPWTGRWSATFATRIWGEAAGAA